MATTREYWKAPSPSSLAKIDIVSKYFATWARIMMQQCKHVPITYVDICSGRGAYEDGTPATPLRILQEADKIPGLMKSLSLHFFEKSRKNHRKLTRNILFCDEMSNLSIPPAINLADIGPNQVNALPLNDCTFTFIDPFGYKGVSLPLITSVLDSWGNDCLFYLSISGIRRNLELPKQSKDLRLLFGDAGYNRLRKKVHLYREKYVHSFYGCVVAELTNAINKLQHSYVLPFAIRYNHLRLISHALVFVSKHHLGFSIMKDIMAEYSHKDSDGFPRFVFDGLVQTELGFATGMSGLRSLLQKRHGKSTLTVKRIIEACHRHGDLVTSANVRHTLERMFEDGQVEVAIPEGKKQGRGFPDWLIITFQ